MKPWIRFAAVAVVLLLAASCGTRYKVKPMPFRSPESYGNAVQVAGVVVAGRAFSDKEEATEAFGFDIRGAGMLPVQVVFDNPGDRELEIHPGQTFLEDRAGNLWPIMARELAYERATRYAETHEMFKEGAYHGFLGAAAGAVIGAAIGVVGGSSVGSAAGKGAAVGAAAGATIGGAKGYASDDARRAVIDDLRSKSLQNRSIEPGGLSYGFIFFPGEAASAARLRMQLRGADTGEIHVVNLDLGP